MSCKYKFAYETPSESRVGGSIKLQVHDWLSDVPNTLNTEDVVEVRFKNTRKDYYKNVNGLKLEVGDMVAVEANPGHDVGMVTMTGDLVLKQMKRHKVGYINGELRKIYRKAKDADIQTWQEAIALEHDTMLRARKIAEDLKLNMKIGDVEYLGDKTKAIFYYIADERVDFRQLIRVYASQFGIKIEMKQIGARQEAGRIGGIGPCGRELCCSSWMTNFVSVTTGAARYQEISLNPQKLAGQCGKLKCCLNYELDCYIDAQKHFPKTNIPLDTIAGKYQFQKADIFKGLLWYSPIEDAFGSLIALKVDTVKEIIRLNEKGEKSDVLISEAITTAVSTEPVEFGNVVGQDSLDRFDTPKKPNHRRKKRRPSNQRNDRGDNKNTQQSRRKEGEGDHEERSNNSRGNNNRNRNRNNNSNNAQNDRRPKGGKPNNPKHQNGGGNGGENKQAKPQNSNAPEKRVENKQPRNNNPKGRNNKPGGGKRRPQRRKTNERNNNSASE